MKGRSCTVSREHYGESGSIIETFQRHTMSFVRVLNSHEFATLLLHYDNHVQYFLLCLSIFLTLSMLRILPLLIFFIRFSGETNLCHGIIFSFFLNYVHENINLRKYPQFISERRTWQKECLRRLTKTFYKDTSIVAIISHGMCFFLCFSIFFQVVNRFLKSRKKDLTCLHVLSI